MLHIRNPQLMIDRHQHRQLSSPFQTLHYRSPVQFQTASPVIAPVQIKSQDDQSEQFSLSKLQDRTFSTSEIENSNQPQERQSSEQLLLLKPKLVEQLSKLNPDQIKRLRILLKDLKFETKLNKGQFGIRKGIEHQKEELRIVPAGKERTSQNWSGRDFERSGAAIMKDDIFENSGAAIMESDIFEKSGTAIMESDIFDRSSRSVNLISNTLALENSPKLPRDEIQLKDTEKAIGVRNKVDISKKGTGVEKTENSAPGLPLLPVSSVAGKKKHHVSKNIDLQLNFEVGLLLLCSLIHHNIASSCDLNQLTKKPTIVLFTIGEIQS